MAIAKSEGTTPSERLLRQLCEKTFLGFWSYANTYRDQGGGKELCDLLVVCGNRLILFSDKSCSFPSTGDLHLDWSRWYRKAVNASAQQLIGAERWLKKYPDKIYLDSKCSQRLPIALDDNTTWTFHRIIVALGAQERCRSQRRGSGSLTLTGEARSSTGSTEIHPFVVGEIVPNAGYFHVFDDFTLPLVIGELDTITDFVSYLEFKEALFRSKKIGRIDGEENLLALFLSDFVQSGDWTELIVQCHDDAVLDIKSGGWEILKSSSLYEESRTLMRPSYVWDRIIQEFATHSFGDSLIPGSPATVAENEQIFRCMAKESRLCRAFLATKMLERWSQAERNMVKYRIVASPSDKDTLYVFVFVPSDPASAVQYREDRQEYLFQYCFLVHSKQRRYKRVIGIATDAADDPYRTFDVLLREGDQWNHEMTSMAREIEADLEVSGEGPIHHIGDGGHEKRPPRPKKRSRKSPSRRHGIVGRNELCPCHSGKKFKHCCWRRDRD